MKKEFNSMSFTPEDVKAGLLIDTVNYLLTVNEKSEDYKNDIHIWTDGYRTIVDWIYKPIEDSEEFGEFRYVSDDQEVVDFELDPDISEDDDEDEEPHEFIRCKDCYFWIPKDEFCIHYEENKRPLECCLYGRREVEVED